MQIKLSNKEALELIVRLWEWLSNNPDKGKFDWPEWQVSGGKVRIMLGLCPACENARRPTGDGSLFVDCDHCILVKLWTKVEPATSFTVRAASRMSEDLPCHSPGSPYQLWKREKDLDRRRAFAKQIADYARKELKKIE